MAKPTDTQLLDFLEAECIDVRCFSSPTGAGDADVMWRCIQHYMAAPKERELGHPAMSIREAIISAIQDRL